MTSDLFVHFAASEDYVPVIQMVYFPPYSERQIIEVTIRDDQGLPRVEGTEEFELVLRTPLNSGIGESSEAVIAIDDSISDCKILLCTFSFASGVFVPSPPLPRRTHKIIYKEYDSTEDSYK